MIERRGVNMSEKNRSPEEREIVASLIKDFRNSYKYSQGNPVLQQVLFTLVRDHYKQTKSETLETLHPALLTVSSHIARFVLPSQHKAIDKADVQEDFRTTFAEFTRCLTQSDYTPEKEVFLDEDWIERPFPKARDERIGLLISITANQDDLYLGEGNRYTSEGRPVGNSGADPYESYFRTYILGGADTHSDTYNAVFTDARHVFAATHPNADFEWHKIAWENHHPNEMYYPEQYIESLATL